MAKKKNLPSDSVLAEVAEKAPAAAKNRPSSVKRQIRVDLTIAEKAILSDLLAQSVENLSRAEQDKSEELSQYNADIKAHRASISKLAQQVNLGYEMREVECPVKYNEPKVGQKSIVHPTSGTVLATEAMEEDERQENLFAEENPAAAGEQAKENLKLFKGKTKPAAGDDPEPEGVTH